MHPGNLLVQIDPPVGGGDPSLVLLDCGVTASLSNRDWDNLHQLFLAIVRKEVRNIKLLYVIFVIVFVDITGKNLVKFL